MKVSMRCQRSSYSSFEVVLIECTVQSPALCRNLPQDYLSRNLGEKRGQWRVKFLSIESAIESDLARFLCMRE